MPRVATQRKQPSQAQLDARAAGAERLRQAAQRRRVAPVRSTRHDVETSEQPIGQTHPRLMRSTGPARKSLEPTLIEPVDRPLDPEKLANLAFMEEEVTVLIHQSENPTAVQFPEVWNGSRKEIFQRGIAKTVKRKFVEVLSRMKITKYHQEKVTDKDGVEGFKYVPYSALVYPFVVENDSEKGRAWLKSNLAEG
jgi:hypothetical protein